MREELRQHKAALASLQALADARQSPIPEPAAPLAAAPTAAVLSAAADGGGKWLGRGSLPVSTSDNDVGDSDDGDNDDVAGGGAGADTRGQRRSSRQPLFFQRIT